MCKYVLMIDDERDYGFVKTDLQRVIEKHNPSDFIVTRTCDMSIKVIEALGFPCFVFLDHDLGIVNGKKETTMDFVNHMLWKKEFFPEYIVHSQNCIGIDNLISKIESFWKSRDM